MPPPIVFTTDVQRRIRLRNSKRFDLEPMLGEPLVVHVGEMPQSQQPKVVAFLSVRGELLEHAAANKRAGESAEAAMRRMGTELLTDDESAAAAKRLGEELSRKLLVVMQDLIGAALLDENGDRLGEGDAKALFELLPATPEVALLMNQMSEAVLTRLGGKKTAPKAAGGEQPSDQPLPK